MFRVVLMDFTSFKMHSWERDVSGLFLIAMHVTIHAPSISPHLSKSIPSLLEYELPACSYMRFLLGFTCIFIPTFNFGLQKKNFPFCSLVIREYGEDNFYSSFIDGIQKQAGRHTVIIRHMLHKCMHHLLHSPWLTTRRSICSLQARTCSSHSLL